MRDAVAAIYQRLADPSVFDSGLAARPIGLFWDAGGGYHPRASRVADVRLNNRGRAWHRFRLTVTGEPLRAVAVAIGSRDELVQLTGMRVHLRSRDGALETRSFEAEALAKVGYSQLHGNLYRVEQEPALMVAPLELERFTGWVDVDVFFGLLEAA
jgi:hypothetical protein